MRGMWLLAAGVGLLLASAALAGAPDDRGNRRQQAAPVGHLRPGNDLSRLRHQFRLARDDLRHFLARWNRVRRAEKGGRGRKPDAGHAPRPRASRPRKVPSSSAPSERSAISSAGGPRITANTGPRLPPSTMPPAPPAKGSSTSPPARKIASSPSGSICVTRPRGSTVRTPTTAARPGPRMCSSTSRPTATSANAAIPLSPSTPKAASTSCSATGWPARGICISLHRMMAARPSRPHRNSAKAPGRSTPARWTAVRSRRMAMPFRSPSGGGPRRSTWMNRERKNSRSALARQPTIAIRGDQRWIAWESRGAIQLRQPNGETTDLGKGSFPAFATSTSGGPVVLLWESPEGITAMRADK